jgi:hypothetical protein
LAQGPLRAPQIKPNANFAEQRHMKKNHVSIAFASALLFLMTAPLPAHADSMQTLLSATSDAFGGALNFQVAVDGDSVAQNFSATATSSGKTLAYPFSDLPAGIVLYNYDNHDVVTLTSSDFDPTHGGDFVVSYLENGIPNDYVTVNVEIERTGDQWQMWIDDQSGNHVVTQAYFQANKVFGEVVGISDITFK